MERGSLQDTAWAAGRIALVALACTLGGTPAAAQADEPVFTLMISFPGKPRPASPVIQVPGGDFYGTTFQGGPRTPFADDGSGTIYRLAPDGSPLWVHRFSGTDGQMPVSAPVLAADGHLYGTTSWGGANNAGVVYRLSSDGVLSVLHSFDAVPPPFCCENHGALVIGQDGAFYGVGTGAVQGALGGVYRITADGQYSVLRTFLDDGGPLESNAALVLAVDGNFYGTSRAGGASGKGTVFRVTPAAALTVLHSFTGEDGEIPTRPLIQAQDGKLYGTTSKGGVGFGAVFKISRGGDFRVLHKFQTGSQASASGLVEACDGWLYGTSRQDYWDSSSQLYRITRDGDYQRLMRIDPKLGTYPLTEMIQGQDSTLYGTTGSSKKVPTRGGSVYRLSGVGGTCGALDFSQPATTLSRGASARLDLTLDAPATIAFLPKFAASGSAVRGDSCTQPGVDYVAKADVVPMGATRATIKFQACSGEGVKAADLLMQPGAGYHYGAQVTHRLTIAE